MPFPMVSDPLKTYEERNNGRVDLAQQKLEKYLKHKKYYYQRFGWDEKDKKIPSREWYQFPKFVKSMPDTIVIHPKLGFIFMETKGCRDYLGLKQDDITQYVEWNKIAQIFIAIYSTTANQLYIVPLVVLVSLLEDNDIPKDKYPDNNKIYFKIPLEYIESYKQGEQWK